MTFLKEAVPRKLSTTVLWLQAMSALVSSTRSCMSSKCCSPYSFMPPSRVTPLLSTASSKRYTSMLQYSICVAVSEGRRVGRLR